MPKPIYGEAGNGMHINMSLFKDGQNVFFDENGDRRLSKEAYHFIAGLLAHVKAITANTNPLVNSYKRLVPGYEAPCYLAWSASNRSALIRIPSARGKSTRVELRSPDPSCNPYLALAVCLAAGLDGIERGLEPPEEITENIFEMDAATRAANGIEDLPSSLEHALFALEADPLIQSVLGPHIYAQFLTGKKKEWEEYCTRVSSWEVAKYLVTYESYNSMTKPRLGEPGLCLCSLLLPAGKFFRHGRKGLDHLADAGDVRNCYNDRSGCLGRTCHGTGPSLDFRLPVIHLLLALGAALGGLLQRGEALAAHIGQLLAALGAEEVVLLELHFLVLLSALDIGTTFDKSHVSSSLLETIRIRNESAPGRRPCPRRWTGACCASICASGPPPHRR